MFEELVFNLNSGNEIKLLRYMRINLTIENTSV